ncbi:MAG: V-type ATP synthase subunit E family protein [Thiohalocapsa sp.]
MTQADELERAIMARAERLANEYRERAKRSRDTILRDAAERLRLREQREEAIARSMGDRHYRQQVQAEELRLQSHLDRMRWNLVRDIEHRLGERTRALLDDEAAYWKTLLALLSAAAAEIEQDELVIEANAHDQRLLRARWSEVEAALPAGKRAQLAEEPIDALTGVLVFSGDGKIRVDNTFEGRMARLGSRLQQAILERLLPGGFDAGSVFGG